MGDKRGAVGNIAMGARTVKRDGIVRFDGTDYQHDILKDWVGERVYIINEGNNCWQSYPVSIFRDENDIYPRSNRLCKIEKPTKAL